MVVAGGIIAQTEAVMTNIISVLKRAGCGLGPVVKVSVWPIGDAGFQHLVSTLVDTLTLARKQLDGQPIEQAKDVLANARRIAFLGVGGGSANVAREGVSRFFRLGIPAKAHADG